MSGRTRILAAAVVVATVLAGAGSAAGGRPFVTALYDPVLFTPFGGPYAPSGAERVAGAGAVRVRIPVRWRLTAPAGATRPADFVADNPADPYYRWAATDANIEAAVGAGLEPYVTIYDAPVWAQGAGSGRVGSVRPSQTDLADFATAAARRYDGVLHPRVRYWEVWNEPNLNYFLSPQKEGGKLVAPRIYRRMVNAFAAAVHDVNPDNVVIAGAQGAKGREGSSTRPLRFMRAMLCLSRELVPSCGATATFDVWSHHPYTTGGPTHHAIEADDVAIGDLPEMRRVLLAAKQRGKIVSPTTPGFWVTEFSWDTDLPDPRGVPAKLHARWVAEALYRMWKARVSTVTWFKVRDNPFPGESEQAGLWYNGRPRASDDGPLANPSIDVPKPALLAFRFPFVALPDHSRTVVWGRLPEATAGTRVVVQRRRSDGTWRRLTGLTTDEYGVFTHRFGSSMRGATLRARTFAPSEIEVSRGFVVKNTADLIVPPFGSN
jgi:hypothetical protein